MTHEDFPRINGLQICKELARLLIGAGQQNHLLVKFNARKSLFREGLEFPGFLQFCYPCKWQRHQRHIDITLKRVLDPALAPSRSTCLARVQVPACSKAALAALP